VPLVQQVARPVYPRYPSGKRARHSGVSNVRGKV